MPCARTALVRFTHLKSIPSVNLRRRPAINGGLDPFGNTNGSDVAAFALKVENDPSFISLLDILKFQFGDFGTA